MNSDAKQKVAWYFRPVPVVILLLSIGPFALPFLWKSPKFKKIHKIIWTFVAILLTYLTIASFAKMYDILRGEIKELERVLNM